MLVSDQIKILNDRFASNFADVVGTDLKWKDHKNYIPFESCPQSNKCRYCRGEQSAKYWEKIFDACICISLVNSDRVAEVSNEFHKNGLCQYVIFFRPRRLESYQYGKPKMALSSLGCWTSHQYAAWCGKHVLEAERLLVFEDDVNFIVPIDHNEADFLSAQLSTLDQQKPNWDVFYLGHFSMYLAPISDAIWKTKSSEAHAYLLSSRGMLNVGNAKFSSYHCPNKSSYEKLASAIDLYMAFHLQCYTTWKHYVVQKTQQEMPSHISSYSKLFYWAHDWKSTHPQLCNILIVLIYLMLLFLAVFFVSKFLFSPSTTTLDRGQEINNNNNNNTEKIIYQNQR